MNVNVKAARSTARKERAFEFEKYASEYCHPSVIQAYIACLSGYRGNGPKVGVVGLGAVVVVVVVVDCCSRI